MPDLETQAPLKEFTDSKYEEQSTSQKPYGRTSNLSIRSGSSYKDLMHVPSSVMTLDEEVNKYNEMIENDDFRDYPGTERDNFDNDFERHGLYKTSLLESVAHIVKGTLGAGVMTMHEAFMVGGLWTSLGTILSIGFINYYAMNILGSTAQLMYSRTRLTKLSYPDLAELVAATGPWKRFRKCSKVFRYTVDFCIVICMGGTCSIYQIMIAKTLKLAFESFNIDLLPWIEDNVRLYIICLTPILICICSIRSLKILAPFSMLSDVLIAVCVLTTLYYSLQTGEDIANRPAWKSTHNFMRVIGVSVYCTCGIAICLPVENNMRNPKEFSFVIKCAMLTVTVLTAATGFFGYWGWGETCRSPITVQMPVTIFTTLLQFLIGFMLCVTFSVQFFVAFRIFWHYLCKKYKRRSRKLLVTLERIYRIIMVLVVTCVAMAFPNLMPFIAFIGHFFMGFIGFVFPAFIECLATWREDRIKKTRWRIVKNFIIICFGIFLSATAFHYEGKLLFEIHSYWL